MVDLSIARLNYQRVITTLKIKCGLLENPPSWNFPSYRPPCSVGSYLLCMFDYWRVGCCWAILGQTNAGWRFGILNMALFFPYIYSFPTAVSKIWLVEVFFTSVSENEIKSCSDGWSCQCRISENFVACACAPVGCRMSLASDGQWWHLKAASRNPAAELPAQCPKVVFLWRAPQKSCRLGAFFPKKRSI